MKRFTLGLITGLFLAISAISFARSGFFADISGTAWYANAVTSLTSVGVISGYPDGTFKPEKPVTRAEAAMMLNRMKEYVDARVEGRPVPTAAVPVTQAPVAAAETGGVAVNPVLTASSNNQKLCTGFSAPSQNTQVTVSNSDELRTAVASANQTGNTTLTLRDGTYVLNQPLWLSGNGIVVRSQSGNRNAVLLKGQGMNGSVDSVFHVSGKNVTVADVTVGWVHNHPIQVHGELDADGMHIYNVHFVDGHEQLLKGSYDANHPELGADNGVVECSLFDYSAGVGPQYYIGGIDVHNGKNWIVRDNTFKNISSPEADLAEHAIHFWSNSQNTLVERNTIINSDRGIGFGLGERGAIGGIIRDNVIFHDASRGDAAIILESAPGVQVYNNRIFFENEYPNAIEYRFGSTVGVNIHDNIANRLVKARDGATGTVVNNLTSADATWFVDPRAGNFILTTQGKTATGKAQ